MKRKVSKIVAMLLMLTLLMSNALLAQANPAATTNVVGNVETLRVMGTFYNRSAFELLDMVNQERENVGLAPLVMDQELLAHARTRALESALWFSHTRANGLQPPSLSSRINAENLHGNRGGISNEQRMRDWMSSPGHARIF